VGSLANSIRKDYKIKDELSIKFFSDEFPEQWRHKYFLVTAGHFYKTMNYRERMGYGDDTLLLGDSGGFQIASGAIKWDADIKDKIFQWLEANSDIAMNLDIPPRMTLQGKFRECLDISKANFKYFADNQTGKTKFLNVIQGTDEHSYMKWYDEVKQFPFSGYAIGGGGSSLYKYMSGLMTLINGKEHLNTNNKYFHILGTSKIFDFMLLAQTQKSLNDIGANIIMTTDSSTPSLAVVYGFYYTNYNFKSGRFNSIHMPKRRDDFQLRDYPLPYCTEFDKYLGKYVTTSDVVDWNKDGEFGMILHNFMFFKDIMDRITDLINGPKYLIEQEVSADMFKILNSIDEMIKGDDPYKVFQKYKHLY